MTNGPQSTFFCYGYSDLCQRVEHTHALLHKINVLEYIQIKKRKKKRRKYTFDPYILDQFFIWSLN